MVQYGTNRSMEYNRKLKIYTWKYEYIIYDKVDPTNCGYKNAQIRIPVAETQLINDPRCSPSASTNTVMPRPLPAGCFQPMTEHIGVLIPTRCNTPRRGNFGLRSPIGLAKAFSELYCSLRPFLPNLPSSCLSFTGVRHIGVVFQAPPFILHRCFPPLISCMSKSILTSAAMRTRVTYKKKKKKR